MPTQQSPNGTNVQFYYSLSPNALPGCIIYPSRGCSADAKVKTFDPQRARLQIIAAYATGASFVSFRLPNADLMQALT
jgi:hypothetical protein